MVRDVQTALIDCDEIWTFLQKKRRQVRPGDPARVGDQYVAHSRRADHRHEAGRQAQRAVPHEGGLSGSL